MSTEFENDVSIFFSIWYHPNKYCTVNQSQNHTYSLSNYANHSDAFEQIHIHTCEHAYKLCADH